MLSHTDRHRIFLAPLSLLFSLTAVLGLRTNCSWSIDATSDKYMLANCYIALATDVGLMTEVRALTFSPYDPGDWIPESLRPPGSWPQPFVLSNVIFQLTFCEPVWTIAEKACTFRLSSTWPSAGLQAGPGFIFFGKIVSQAVVADRLNVTCPLSDWARLLESRGQGSSSSGVDDSPPLAPCGTATVFTGRQLVEALEQLQQGHARVMLNLAANVSLPADPTPQRELNAFDDSHPLVQMYRNVTLVAPMAEPGTISAEYGLRTGAMVELDVRKRRNAFQITKAPDQEGQPVLIFADMNVANVPPGPPSSWPIGLLSVRHSYLGLNRSATAGVQLISLRSRLVITRAEIGYMNYWLTRTNSVLASERSEAAWLFTLMGHIQSVDNAEGGNYGHTTVINFSGFMSAYNGSVVATPLLTVPTPNDFGLWSPEGSALPSAATQKEPPLPPTSFAVAQEARTLFQLLVQAPWSGSSARAILLLNNITLVPGEWPERGVTIPYNLTLVGPGTGDPVWLDTAGLPLLAASNSSGGSSAAGAQPPAPVNVLQLHRVRLVGFTPPLLTASAADVAEADEGGAFMAGPELKEWRDSCLQRDLVSSVPDSVGSTSTATTTTATTTATRPLLPWSHDLRNCVIEMPRSVAQLLWLYNSPGRCAAVVDDGPAAGAAGSASRALCDIIWGNASLQQSPYQLPSTLQKLVSNMLAIVPLDYYVSSSSSASATFTLHPSVAGLLTNPQAINATMAGGAITLSQSTLVAIEDAVTADASSGVSLSSPSPANGNSVTTRTFQLQEPCEAGAFLLAIQAAYGRLPPTKVVNTSPSTAIKSGPNSRSAAALIVVPIIGAVFLLVAGIIIVVLLHNRKQRQKEAAAGALFLQPVGDTVITNVSPDKAAAIISIHITDSTNAHDNNGPDGGSSSDYQGFSASFLQANAVPAVMDGKESVQTETQAVHQQWTMADMLLHAAGGTQATAAATAAAAAAAAAAGKLGKEVWAGCKVAGGRPTPAVDAGRRQQSLEGRAMPSLPERTAVGCNLKTIMDDEIEAMLQKCKAAVSQNANSSGTSSGMSRRGLQLLGRGAYGSVYKGVWRGLPAAVKVMIVHAGDSEERRRRLAREAALTSALSHPNIVPTYHYEMEVVREAGPTAEPHKETGSADDDGTDIVALRMRLVMQYCEGGTLQEALKDGKFGETVATLLQKKGHPQGIHQASMLRVGTPPEGVGTAGPQRAQLQHAAAATATATSPANSDASNTAPVKPPTAAEVISKSESLEPALANNHIAANGSGPKCGGAHPNHLLAGVDPPIRMHPWNAKLLAWEDLIPADNMPLSLLAALDILRGLEYLHSHGVIHGDLTENNVLLKAVQPILSSSKLTVSSPSEKLSATLLGAAETAARYYDGTGRTDKRTDTSRFSSDSTTLGEPSRLYQAPMSASTNPTDTPTLAPTLRLPPQMGLPCRMEENTVGGVTHGTHEQSATGQRQANNNSAFASVQQQGMDTSSNTAGPLSDGPTSSVLATRRSQHEGSSSLGQPVSPNQDELMKQGPSRARAWLRQVAANSDCSVAQTRAAKSTQSEKPFTTGANKVPVAYRRSLDENNNREGQTLGILSTGSLSGRGSSQAAGGIAAQMLAWAFKISDFGLAAETHGQSQSHLSNMAQGTPFFAAPEVVHLGRLSPAADIYSFGVLMWLLLHGVALIQLRHLLPRMPHVPIGDLLLFNTCTTLPMAARELLEQCLASEPARRPTVKSLVRVLEQLLRDVAGPELSQILLSVERREQHVWAPEQAEAVGGR